jgi:hypothetical protein
LDVPAPSDETRNEDHASSLGTIERMRTISLAACVAVVAGMPALADGTVPEAYQGVWAAARDCKANFQNVLDNVVNREFAACRVVRVTGSARAEANTSAVDLDCGGPESREIWRSETIDGSDLLVIVRLGPGADAGSSSIDIYKRCLGIPIGEIPLSEIPGNPVADAAPAGKSMPSPAIRTWRRHPAPHASSGQAREKRSHH